MSAVRIDESTQCFIEIPFSFVFTKKADMRAINQLSENMWSYDTQNFKQAKQAFAKSNQLKINYRFIY